MKTLDLKVGTKCNNNCRHCVVAESRGVFPDRTLEEIFELMESGRETCGRLVLTGGELTVRKDCFEIVNHARELEYDISIQTNARMFSYRNFTDEFLAAAGRDITVLAALLSAESDVHNYITSRESFHQTVAGIVNLQEAGTRRVDLNTVVTKINYPGLAAHAALASSLQVASVQYAFVHVGGNAKLNEEEVVPRMSEAISSIKSALDILAGNGIEARTEAVPFCILGDHYGCASEPIIPDSVIADFPITILDFTQMRKWEKRKGPRCVECVFNDECEGPWRQYPDKFGWDEFIPVRNRKK